MRSHRDRVEGIGPEAINGFGRKRDQSAAAEDVCGFGNVGGGRGGRESTIGDFVMSVDCVSSSLRLLLYRGPVSRLSLCHKAYNLVVGQPLSQR